MLRLIFINLLFALGLAFFVIHPITNNWAWLALIAAWCIAEAILSKDTSIKWWQWLLLFMVLGLMDVAIVFYLR